MDRARVNAICAALPGAVVNDPWGGGHDCWKVAGRMFALQSVQVEGVSVKTADIETAALLIEIGVGRKAPYMHRSWVNVRYEAGAEEIEARILASYRIIRSGLPKRVLAELAPFP